MTISATSTARTTKQTRVDEVEPTAEPLNVEQAQAAVASKHLLDVRRPNDPAQVVELKRLLAAKGYDVGDVTKGDFDEKVLAAVAKFQADNNLTKDGVVGQQTWAALLGVPGASRIPPGNDWLIAWARLLEQRGDVFLDAATPNGVDLGASLKPENATDAPMYRQADIRWGGRIMSHGSVLRAKGCAVSAMAMALSGATGKQLNPGELDAYLDRHGGYSGDNNIIWAVAGKAAGVHVQRRSNATLSDIEKSLKAKRPVTLGVDYKKGSATDHWITITGVAMDTKGQKVFLANDPATGGVIRLYPNKDGGLRSYAGGMGDYRSTGDAVFLG